MQARFPLAFALLAALPATAPPVAAQKMPDEMVQTLRCPDDGIQPRVAVDASGVLHLVYFKGQPEAGDLFYRSSTDWGETFSDAIPVNRRAGIVDASTTFRAARIALGASGRMHVAWLGAAEEALPEGERPLWYARSDAGVHEFEPPRRIAGESHAVDVPPSVVEVSGRVLVFWHEPAPSDGAGPAAPSDDMEREEPPRHVFMATSEDGGETFGAPETIDRDGCFVNGHCNMGVAAQDESVAYVLFQGIRNKRLEWRLLSTQNAGRTFRCRFVDNWGVPRKVATTATLNPGVKMIHAAYESYGKVWLARIEPTSRKHQLQMKPRDTGEWRGRPVATSNGYKTSLLVWLEGDRPLEPDRIVWQGFYLPERRSVGMGRLGDIPDGTIPAVFTRPDETFVVVY